VSCGKQVSGFTTALGRLDVMCQNPATGVVHLGHSGGTTECVFVFVLSSGNNDDGHNIDNDSHSINVK